MGQQSVVDLAFRKGYWFETALSPRPSYSLEASYQFILEVPSILMNVGRTGR
jgi:hypothetical protein